MRGEGMRSHRKSQTRTRPHTPARAHTPTPTHTHVPTQTFLALQNYDYNQAKALEGIDCKGKGYPGPKQPGSISSWSVSGLRGVMVNVIGIVIGVYLSQRLWGDRSGEGAAVEGTVGAQ